MQRAFPPVSIDSALFLCVRPGRDAQFDPAARVGFFGLDLYSLFDSIGAVLDYLDRVDPAAPQGTESICLL